MEIRKTVELRSGAWFGDRSMTICFPPQWDVEILGNNSLPSLSIDQIRARIGNPIGTQKLHELAAGKQRVVIVVDDLTRPTPVASIIPIIFEEMGKAGVKQDSISILIAGGTHPPASQEDIEKKLGKDIASNSQIITHDARNSIVYLGESTRGTPLYVNKNVVESDLVIGIGCIYPHPAAGFSGGAKIIAPGVCGSETVRYLHDYLRPGIRGKYQPNVEFLKEMEEIANRVGLDFIVNVVLNQRREIAELVAGDKIAAHAKGVQFATERFSITPVSDADIVIMDVYPFDMSFQFAKDRGLWLLEGVPQKTSKVVIASFPAGLGTHELYPVNRQLSARISRRLKHFRLKEFRFLPDKLRAIKRIISLRNQKIMVLSAGITSSELKSVFPGARLFGNWDEIIQKLISIHKNYPVKVALYKCSPYLIPMH